MHVFAFALLCQSLYPYACSALLVEMLRLAATRITLDSKDTALHVRRHEKRMEDCKQATDNPQSQPSSPRFHHIPNEFWRPSSRTRRPSPQEIPIYSDEPVPRDSQAFWDRIIADAGSSATVHQQSLARSPQVIVPSAASLENNSSVRLSIRGDNEDEDDHNQSSHSVVQEPLIFPRSPVSESSSTLSPEAQSSGSQSSLPSLDRQENRLRTQPRQPSFEQTEPYSSVKEDTDSDVTLVNRLSRSPMRENFDRDSPWTRQMDLDGPSDAAPTLQHHRSASSLQDPEPGSVGMPFRAQARRAELAASRSAASRTNEPLSGTELRNSSSSQTRYADPHPVQHIRTRSGGLQRSRLYISEAAASSSPDKRQLSPPRSDDAGPADEGYLLSVPRRRERHKHRSQSYSHIASDASATPSSPQGSIHHHPTSSPYHRSNLSHSSHSSSSYPYGMSPHSRHDSSVELPYTSPNPLRRTFESHAPPFRVASRTPSTNAPLPPDYTPTNENGRYSGSPYLHSTPPRSLSSPSIAATPSRISVYNDNRSPSAQPQTPIGLPRHGIPPMPMQNPFFTAPVRAGARIRQGAAGWLHSAFATPSRAERRREVGGWVRSHEQENVGVDVEAQRRDRIEEEERLRTGYTRSGRAWRMSDWER